MGKPLDQVRVLLVQARATADMEQQEQTCFQERCRLAPGQFTLANVAHHALHEDLLDGADALMIGGAGEYSATEDYPWMENALSLIRAAVGRSLPTFGSCWGHQMIARALGGTVVHDPGRAEFGCREVVLTEAGLRDRLFCDFPARFLANMGHHDRVTALPVGGVELAANDLQPFEAFRIAGKPVYGTQFHSELDARRERERLYRYRGHYSDTIPDEDAFQAILDNLAETSEVDHLLHDFLVKFVVSD